MSKDIKPTPALLYETKCIVNELMEKKGIDSRVKVDGGKIVWIDGNDSQTLQDEVNHFRDMANDLFGRYTLALEACKNANKLFTEIMPQAGRLVFQDYGLLNDTLIMLDKITRVGKRLPPPPPRPPAPTKPGTVLVREGEKPRRTK